MAAAVAFALWFSSTPTPPTTGELATNASTHTTTPAAHAGTGELVVLKLVNPAIVDACERWLKENYHSPIGTRQQVSVEGRPLVFILQWHYHPPGFVGGPTGKHKGVTVFEER